MSDRHRLKCRQGATAQHHPLRSWRRALFSSLCLTIMPMAVVSAHETTASVPPSNDPYAGHVAEAAGRFGLPERWIRAVLRAESAGRARAVSPAGAIGLMQVMPTTWTELRVRHKLGRDPFSPRDNILAGTAYLRELYDRYGSIEAMLAAYNAGPGRYDAFRGSGRPLPAATRSYVAALVPLLAPRRLGAPAGGATAASRGWRDAPIFAGSEDLPNSRQPQRPNQPDSMFWFRNGAGDAP